MFAWQLSSLHFPAATTANAKAPDATWYGDYGGYVAIGYNPAKVKVAPTSFKDLLKPIYKNQIAINNNPTEASAAFCPVWAAALANGGSFDNIHPGITYFAKLRKEGNFEPVVGGPTTVENGTTPILIWWDYLLASEVNPRSWAACLLLFGSAFSAYATAEAMTAGALPLTAIQIGSFLNGNVIAGQQNVGKALGLGMVLIIAILMIVYTLLQRRAARWLR